jgi:hypothetical protein
MSIFNSSDMWHNGHKIDSDINTHYMEGFTDHYGGDIIPITLEVIVTGERVVEIRINKKL